MVVAQSGQRMDKQPSSVRRDDDADDGLTSWRTSVLGSLDDFTPALMTIYDSLSVNTPVAASTLDDTVTRASRRPAVGDTVLTVSLLPRDIFNSVRGSRHLEDVMADVTVSAVTASNCAVTTSNCAITTSNCAVATSNCAVTRSACAGSCVAISDVVVTDVIASSVSESLPDVRLSTPASPVDSLPLPSDNKKRPLSVSSTSSSNSSTSSLTRHHNKRVAATVTTSVAMTTTSVPSLVPRGENQPIGREDYTRHVEDKLSSEETEKMTSDDAEKMTSDDTEALCADMEQEEMSPVKGVSFVDKVLSEILTTERSYVTDLCSIVQGYLSHFCQLPQSPLTADVVAALFGNIEDIYHFNKTFLAELEKCDRDALRVAECFLQHKQGFSIYAQYCTNYPNSVDVLVCCMRRAELADVFKRLQVQLGHGLPLGAYLLKPIQRVLKYHLLLQKIVNNYEERDGVYATLVCALCSMTDMAEHINKMKGKHEHAVHVQEIQSVLYGWDGDDLTTYGDLSLEGSFRMSGVKGCRLLFLFEKGLLIAKKEKDGSLIMKASIKCSNLMLIESVPKEPLSFHLIPFDNPRGQHTAQAANLNEKRKWCTELKRLILENYPKEIPDKVKQLVLKLGKSREEEGITGCSVDGPSRKHSALEYLERRRGPRRKSTSIIPDFTLLKSRRGARKSPPPTRRRSDITRPTFNTCKSEPAPCISEEVSELSEGSESGEQRVSSSTELADDGRLSAEEGEQPASPTRRAESFRIATISVNRVDSIMLARQRRGGKTKSVDNSTRPTSEFNHLLPPAMTRSTSADQIGGQQVAPAVGSSQYMCEMRLRREADLRKACLARKRASPVRRDMVLYAGFCAAREKAEGPSQASSAADPWVRQPDSAPSPPGGGTADGAVVFDSRAAYVTTAGALVRDHATDRTICRLATPPRQLLTSLAADLHLTADLRLSADPDLVAELAVARDQRRAISRLGTPPRDALGNGAIYVNRNYTDVELEARLAERRVGRDHTLEQRRVWRDVRDPTRPTSRSADQPGRFASSPSLPGDGLVLSLRNAVTNLASRLRSPVRPPIRPPVRLPVRPPARLRTKSTSALDTVEQVPSKERQRKRYRFLSQLAKAYSERSRQRPDASEDQALVSLLQAQGGSALGARMAEPARPQGTYTLRDGAHLPRDIGPSRSCSSSSIDSCAADCAPRPGYDSGCPPAESPIDMQNLCDQTLQQLGMSKRSLDSSDSECYDSDDADFENFYYESRFLADVEAGLCCEDVFRDSAIYSDDGTAYKPDDGVSDELDVDVDESVLPEEKDMSGDEAAQVTPVAPASNSPQQTGDADGDVDGDADGDVDGDADGDGDAGTSDVAVSMAPVYASDRPPPPPPGRQTPRPAVGQLCAQWEPSPHRAVDATHGRQPGKRWYLTYAYRPTLPAPLPKPQPMSAAKKGSTL